MLQQQQLGSSLPPAGSKRFHPSHFSGVYGSKTPCFSQHIDKKVGITLVYREENKHSCPWERWTALSCSLPAIACDQYLFTCERKVCRSTLPRWMQAPAGLCYLTLSLGLFVFGFQLSYHDICVLCIPWRVSLDQTTTCHTQQQIKAVWASCGYISHGIGKLIKLSLVENILVCSKDPLDHVSFSLGWLQSFCFSFMCTVWNLKGSYAIYRHMFKFLPLLLP